MKPLPQTVLRGLQRASDVHPSADLLTAFSEKRLPSQEKKFVLDHIAACMECREILALATPAPELTSVVIRRHSTLWRPVLSWGGLAAAIAVAALLLFVNDNDRTKIVTTTQTTDAVVIAKNTSDIPAGLASRDLSEQTGSSRKTAQNTSTPTLSAKRPSTAINSRDVGSLIALNQPTEAKNPGGGGGLTTNGAIAADKVNAFQAASAPAAQSAPAPQMRESFAASVSQSQTAIELKDARYPHWTLDPDGTLLRASNTNGAWEKVLIPGNTVMLRAIATIGPDVWVGGASGVIFHSPDGGANWVPVKAAANGAPLADDVINIEFTTAQQGSLTTSHQQIWTTSDGGQSWNVR